MLGNDNCWWLDALLVRDEQADEGRGDGVCDSSRYGDFRRWRWARRLFALTVLCPSGNFQATTHCAFPRLTTMPGDRTADVADDERNEGRERYGRLPHQWQGATVGHVRSIRLDCKGEQA